jgi:hypothetical protein
LPLPLLAVPLGLNGIILKVSVGREALTGLSLVISSLTLSDLRGRPRRSTFTGGVGLGVFVSSGLTSGIGVEVFAVEFLSLRLITIVKVVNNVKIKFHGDRVQFY